MAAPTPPGHHQSGQHRPQLAAHGHAHHRQRRAVHFHPVKLEIRLRAQDHPGEHAGDDDHRLRFHADEIHLIHHVAPDRLDRDQRHRDVPAEQRPPSQPPKPIPRQLFCQTRHKSRNKLNTNRQYCQHGFPDLVVRGVRQISSPCDVCEGAHICVPIYASRRGRLSLPACGERAGERGFHNRGEVPPLPGPLLHTGVEEREKKRGAIHWRSARRTSSHTQ